MKYLKNTENIADIVIEILYYHRNTTLLVSHVVIMLLNANTNSQKYKEKNKNL